MAQARGILLETFIIYDDKVGQQLRQVLIDAARRGVRSRWRWTATAPPTCPTSSSRR
jgi:phosphatidylserine/phosphatidylglycerophosphate/cardiolipin synthase-like enzyme